MEYFIDKLVDAIIGCIFGIVAYICTRSLDKWTRNFIVARKIDSLLKEIKEGLDIMKNELRNSLPEKSWKEEFITNEDTFIISAVSKSEKNKPEEFSPNDIKEHCKNYFENITQHWQKFIEFPIVREWRKILEERKNTEEWKKIQKDIETTEKIIKMLERTKFLLEKNYKKRLFPK